jgi:predicted NBD/HSP70 family sugar kinase
MRQYNERLILSLIRERGPLSRGETARLTGMSPQASAVIMSALEAEGMLRKGAPQRGQVGQPSIPMVLDPEGAFSFGLKVGRRSAELILLDFEGSIRASESVSYVFPDPDEVVDFARSRTNQIMDGMTRRQIGRISGLGIAAPQEIWNWGNAMGASPEGVEAWRNANLPAQLRELGEWPVVEFNDATAACAAEIAFGVHHDATDFLYIFVATVIGGGVVLDGALFPGRRGFAGAVGSAPVRREDGSESTLADCASIFVLERMLADAGLDPAQQLLTHDYWQADSAILDRWLSGAADALAQTIAAAVSVIDFERIVIDGSLPATVRQSLVERVRRAVAARQQKGVAPATVEAGSLGALARAHGAAVLPILADFGRDREILFD